MELAVEGIEGDHLVGPDRTFATSQDAIKFKKRGFRNMWMSCGQLVWHDALAMLQDANSVNEPGFRSLTGPTTSRMSRRFPE
jgi:hypothetical protein